MTKKNTPPDLAARKLEAINLIYDLVSNPDSLPELVERVSHVYAHEDNPTELVEAAERSAHFAKRLSEQPDVDLSRDIGVIIVGINARNIVTHVPPLAESMLGAKFKGNKAGIGWLQGASNTQTLAQLLSTNLHDNFPVHRSLRDGIQSGVIARLIMIHEFRMSESAETALTELYDFTPAEMRLARLIGEGQTLKEAAETLGVSRETIRTHLKRIFSKTGLRRQSELVQMLTQVSAAAAIHEFGNNYRAETIPDWKNGLISLQTILCQTRFGTKVAYSKFGDPHGRPVLLCHHTIGSRYHTRHMAEAAKANGVLIFKPDRPGAGHSELLPVMSLDHVGYFFEDLLSDLRLDTVDCIAFGAGGRTFLDAVPLFHDRVRSLSLYSLLGIAKAFKRDVWRNVLYDTMQNPTMMVHILNIMKSHLTVEKTMANMKKYYQESPADLKVVSDPDRVANMVNENLLAGRQGFACTRFDHDNLKTRVPDMNADIYHFPIRAIYGDMDTYSLPEMNRDYLAAIPNLSLYRCNGHGQQLINGDFDIFLKTCLLPDQCDWVEPDRDTLG